MADVTVGIVLSSGPDLYREAIDCVLDQDGVQVEVVVVGKSNRYSFESRPEPRVKFLDVPNLPTQAELLRLLAARGNAPFVMSLKAHEHLLPNALVTLVTRMHASEKIDMAYALPFPADKDGNISSFAYHDQWERAHKLRKFEPSNLKDYLTVDFLLHGIKLYRRHSLASKVFSVQETYSDYALVWAIHSLLDIELVPAPLCIGKGSLPITDSKNIDTKDYILRVFALLEKSGAQSTNFKTRQILRLAAKYYWRGSRVRHFWLWPWNKLRRWYLSFGLSNLLYRLTVWLFQKWPLVEPWTVPNNDSRHKKIGYYIWQYPVLSQTFVQREVAALRRAGNDVVVISEIEPEHDFICKLKSDLAASALSNAPDPDVELAALKRKFFRRYPFRYMSLFLFVMGRHYHANKNHRFDKHVFYTVINLASLAEKHGIRHLHSPWADKCAFVALLAARMVGISYSLQARAHDIHRNSYKYCLLEKLQNAEFIVTNTQYNVNQIRAIIGDKHVSKINLIYNGLNLDQFQPKLAQGGGKDEVRLLCVARLIEQKGLTYLLKACRRLLDTGLNVRCDIVGGFEDIFMNYYIELKRLHRALELESSVHFAGSLPFDDVLDYYRKADIFVLPCVLARDGSRDIVPNSVLEAMAMHVPVVSTRVTGLPEMIDHGQTGFLVPPGDVDALVQAIRKLALSPKLRAAFGVAGRKQVEQRFDSDKNVAGYQRLFHGLQGPPVTVQRADDVHLAQDWGPVQPPHV